ncbi:DUF305 domain-containing protein [Novilysobacter spongiicola]|uniref:DUF305 domain-containing protein n=1 Tax=Lysobacter spongiicola DSM 21749 TaxID=1122188 RepID=A0A1T4SII7_9GAMM|nr:DUF305 domain-containing protein [Lysobacter spongiicola]SKA27965.1 protein of unknown function [Lysobacter spongiicola DSM 21749]
MKMSYWRFAAMIATSTLVMFVLMYLNTYVLDHVHWSETRAWMALMMGATMAFIMLAFMLSMYKKRAVNIAIFVGSIAVFALSLWLVRSQATIDDSEYMEAMIPHHSIAIMTSTRAQISDPRVRKLADEIVAAQRREIAEMKYLVAHIESGAGEVDALHEPSTQPRVVPAAEAIHSATIATIDLEELQEAEITKVLGGDTYCGFHYSAESGPVAAMRVDRNGAGRGVLKLHGMLVELASSAPAPDGALTLAADGIELVIDRPAEAASGGTSSEADGQLILDEGLEVGYRGHYRCQQPGA